MQEIYIHPHALKHGLSEDEIKEAWRNFVAQTKRLMPKDDQIVCVGFCKNYCDAIQMIAVENEKGLLVFHAKTPPQASILKELGIEKKKGGGRKNGSKRAGKNVQRNK